MTFLFAQNLSLTFSNGVRALRDVSFAVEESQFISILGPSGCGKSTLLRIIAGLLKPTDGTLSGEGVEARSRRELSFVFQTATLLPWRTVEQNVRLPLELRGDANNARERIAAVIELAGLRDFAHAFPHELSGGMQMRASLARALVIKPRMILLDEPFGALDDMTRQRLNEELLLLWERERFTALFVTHNVAEAAFLSQRVLIMSPRPGTISDEVTIPFAYPRVRTLRSTAEFAALTGDIAGRASAESIVT